MQIPILICLILSLGGVEDPPEVEAAEEAPSESLTATSIAPTPHVVRSIAEAMRDPESVQHLKLEDTGLTSLPEEIWLLTNLRRLDVDNNQITSVPPEIGNLVHLVELDLDKNQLTSLPPEIGKLKNLVSLDLDHNKLDSLPEELGSSLSSPTWILSKINCNACPQRSRSSSTSSSST